MKREGKKPLLLESSYSRSCCSTLEQIFLNQVKKGNEEKLLAGWRISQVEKLVGLARRDIQRACYDGKGGAGILSPKEGGWGYRIYSEEDLATLFLVAQMKREGLSLPEAKHEIERLKEASNDESAFLKEGLERCCWRLEEELEEIQAQLIRAQALQSALADYDDDDSQAGYDQHESCKAACPTRWQVQYSIVWHLVEEKLASCFDNVERSRASASQAFCATCESIVAGSRKTHASMDGLLEEGAQEIRRCARSFIARLESPAFPAERVQELLLCALYSPGVDLAIELWLGAGSFLLLCAAFEECLNHDV